MDERQIFDRFHDALDAEPRRGAFERLQTALVHARVVRRGRLAWLLPGSRTSSRLLAPSRAEPQRRASAVAFVAALLAIVIVATLVIGAHVLRSSVPAPAGTSVGKADAWIVFERPDVARGIDPTLFLVRPNGTGRHALLPGFPNPAFEPSWSPDGQRIAFSAERITPTGVPVPARNDLWIVNADGTNLRMLVSCDSPCNTVNAPVWSADSRKILFGQDDLPPGPGGVPTTFEFKVLDLASNATTTVVTRHDGMPVELASWSPDGSQIVYTKARLSREGAEIGKALFVTDLAGGPERQLTSWDTFAANPQWGPNGLIVFATNDFGIEQPNAASNLFLIKPDGTGLTPLTTFAAGTVRACRPSWAHGGTAVLFTKFDPTLDVRQMATINADGTGLGLATPTGVEGTDAVFRPIR
jgi:Tol biopolymer transport system component